MFDFPSSRNEWRLDIVSILAVLGESNIKIHAQAISASRLCPVCFQYLRPYSASHARSDCLQQQPSREPACYGMAWQLQRNCNEGGFKSIDTFRYPSYDIDIKASHLGACINGVFLKGLAAGTNTNRENITGWGGDWITFYGEWRRDSEDEPVSSKYVREHMANRQERNYLQV
ncbi:MAG: hypothetical protein Q9185_004477 [Variospora sp. 1 TL-2023]